MAKKSKVVDDVPQLKSWAEVDASIAEIAMLKADAAEKISVYNKQEQEQRKVLADQIAAPMQRVETLGKAIMRYAEENRADFGDFKTKTLTHGLVCFRESPPAVKPRKGHTFASALERIKESVEWVKEFVRTKDELDKDAIKRSAALWSNTAAGQELPEGAISDEQLAKFGLAIVQEELFYYEEKNAIALEKIGN